MRRAPLLALALATACTPAGNGGGGGAELPGGSDTQPFAGIGAEETLRFTGTEPFWGGEVSGGRLVYTTPEQPAGEAIAVERFAGRGGLSFSGTLAGRAFDMAVTQGECSDGMSDRTYPFAVTLRLGEETRQGCGWTEAAPYFPTGPV